MSNYQSPLKKVLVIALLVLAQIILNNTSILGSFVYISFIPLILLLLPLQQDNIISMILMFFIGLIIDVLSLDIIGINAGAAVLICALRKPVLRLCFNITDHKYTPEVTKSSLLNHFECLFILSIIYFCFYSIFDGFISISILAFIARILASCLVTSAISLLLCFSILNNK